MFSLYSSSLVILNVSQQHHRTIPVHWPTKTLKASQSPGTLTLSTRVQDIAEQITQTSEKTVKLRKTETRSRQNASKETDCWLGSVECLLWER